jgi:hypothetical protein
VTEYLPHTELHQLTGYARPTAQARWLAEQGIPHRQDGRRIIVSRLHVQRWLEGKATPNSGGFNWAAVK